MPFVRKKKSKKVSMGPSTDLSSEHQLQPAVSSTASKKQNVDVSNWYSNRIADTGDRIASRLAERFNMSLSPGPHRSVDHQERRQIERFFDSSLDLMKTSSRHSRPLVDALHPPMMQQVFVPIAPIVNPMLDVGRHTENGVVDPDLVDMPVMGKNESNLMSQWNKYKQEQDEMNKKLEEVQMYEKVQQQRDQLIQQRTQKDMQGEREQQLKYELDVEQKRRDKLRIEKDKERNEQFKEQQILLLEKQKEQQEQLLQLQNKHNEQEDNKTRVKEEILRKETKIKLRKEKTTKQSLKIRETVNSNLDKTQLRTKKSLKDDVIKDMSNRKLSIVTIECSETKDGSISEVGGVSRRPSLSKTLTSGSPKHGVLSAKDNSDTMSRRSDLSDRESITNLTAQIQTQKEKEIELKAQQEQIYQLVEEQKIKILQQQKQLEELQNNQNQQLQLQILAQAKEQEIQMIEQIKQKQNIHDQHQMQQELLLFEQNKQKNMLLEQQREEKEKQKVMVSTLVPGKVYNNSCTRLSIVKNLADRLMPGLQGSSSVTYLNKLSSTESNSKLKSIGWLYIYICTIVY